MKFTTIGPEAAALYEGGLSIDAVAEALHVSYRTARKAIFSVGVTLRDPSSRLMGRTRPDKALAHKLRRMTAEQGRIEIHPVRSQITQGGVMELADDEWAMVRDVAEARAMQMTHGDMALSQDLASLVIERLFLLGDEKKPDHLKAYVRQMTTNAYLDRKKKMEANYRPQTIKKGDIDDAVRAEVEGVFKYQLNSTSPSRKLVRREVQQARAEMYLTILESLPEKKQQLVRLAAEGLSHKEIAEELGYKSPQVVKTTLHRAYAEIREQFDLRYSDFFGSST